MTKDSLVHDIKTAGVVIGATLALNSCDRPLSQEQSEIVSHKADSAAMTDINFRISQHLIEIGNGKVVEYHNANVDLVKRYSKKYINKNIKDTKLRKIMFKGIEKETLNFISESSFEESDENTNVSDSTVINTRYIRQNQRWYHDLMMYLAGNYTDKQLLHSEFFKVISDKGLKYQFENNLKQIDMVEKELDFAYDKSAKIYNDIWNHYAKEVKSSNKR